jgi:hypothetical protein
MTHQHLSREKLSHVELTILKNVKFEDPKTFHIFLMVVEGVTLSMGEHHLLSVHVCMYWMEQSQ